MDVGWLLSYRAREGTGMSCRAWGSVRIQGNGVGECLGRGEVLVFVRDEVGQNLRASQSGCSVVWRIVGTVGLM